MYQLALTNGRAQENGVDMAIQCIYRDMEYAKSLVKAKAGKNTSPSDADDEYEPEESWTFVGDDIDSMHHSVILNPAGVEAQREGSGKGLGSKPHGAGT